MTGYLKKIKLIWIFIVLTPVFITAIIQNRFNPQKEFNIVALSALAYLILASIHHLKEKNLTLGVFLEYTLIAILFLIVLQSILI